jgi:hypothetical protein
MSDLAQKGIKPHISSNCYKRADMWCVLETLKLLIMMLFCRVMYLCMFDIELYFCVKNELAT